MNGINPDHLFAWGFFITAIVGAVCYGIVEIIKALKGKK